MLELTPTEAAIIACHGPAPALDRLPNAGVRVRIAADELWLIGERSARAELARAARAHAGVGLVVDQTDGWAIWMVRGEGRRAVLDRLMFGAVPVEAPGFAQGAIAGVSGKVLVLRDALLVFVPAPVGHHLRDRIREACADLDIVESAPAVFPVPVEEPVTC